MATSVVAAADAVPRARVFAARGGTAEWPSQLLPRYRRRSRALDETILGTYLAGANPRRIRGRCSRSWPGRRCRAAPSAESCGRCASGSRRGAGAARSRADRVSVFGWNRGQGACRPPRADRAGPRRARGHGHGRETALALPLMGSESRAAWRALVDDLVDRGLPAPALVVIDGNPGLRHAVVHTWPPAAVLRGIVHNLRNLEAQAPKRSHEEIRAMFHAITEADRLDGAGRLSAVRAHVASPRSPRGAQPRGSVALWSYPLWY